MGAVSTSSHLIAFFSWATVTALRQNEIPECLQPSNGFSVGFTNNEGARTKRCRRQFSNLPSVSSENEQSIAEGKRKASTPRLRQVAPTSQIRMLRSHLDMIGRNEPIQRKAKFWQSYVRALKGTDDMRAPESSRRPYGIFRPLLTSEFPEYNWPHTKSIYDDPIHAHDRITTPGYRYDPVSRETYGFSPRNIYPYHYSGRYRPGGYNPYTSYGYDPMYLGEKEPEDKEPYLDSFTKEHPHYYNPVYSIAKPISPSYRPWNYTPLHSAKPLPKSDYTIKPESPSEKAAFNFQGQPLYTRGGLTRRPLSELLEPRTSIPWSSIVRDPWWWEYPELRPYKSPYSYPYSSNVPFYLRDSYLSPVKRQYLWTKHPIRPLSGLY